MPIYRLTDDIIFPRPELSEADGLLAVGGDLSEKRLLLAYSLGIFPWYSDAGPILWWSPDPRLILLPEELKVSRSLRQAMDKGLFSITLDTAFERVITSCAEVQRDKQTDTWITSDMIDAYFSLHNSGYAHSVEAWSEGELAGGLYGVSLGGIFFGESMFSLKSNASKVAFVRLVRQLKIWGFTLIDCQVTTRHLISLGARETRRSWFLKTLRRSLKMPSRTGKWSFDP